MYLCLSSLEVNLKRVTIEVAYCVPWGQCGQTLQGVSGKFCMNTT